MYLFELQRDNEPVVIYATKSSAEKGLVFFSEEFPQHSWKLLQVNTTNRN